MKNFTQLTSATLCDKTILITGGTGTLGCALVEHLLQREDLDVNKIIIFSRDEQKQRLMADRYRGHKRYELLRFFLGDIREKARLKLAFQSVDFVIHAAALKIVDAGEYNPVEFVKTNIDGTINVAEAAIECNVERAVFVSTDKAVEPVNLYGGTKFVSEKVFLNVWESFSDKRKTAFSCVRYGNVVDSRGSVVEYLRSWAQPSFPLTDPRMTRFFLKQAEAVRCVLTALVDCLGGEIVVFKMPSFRIEDLIKCVRPDLEISVIGPRCGEKLHENLISGADCAAHIYDAGDNYRIFAKEVDYKAQGWKECRSFPFSSGLESNLLTHLELEQFLND